ncbi:MULTISPECIES: hypothetical protein [Moorena]|uniref:Uncharacterized protein n=1 Tax=Moorena producens 3L TaxID=489825 RepID=F4Y3T5_9CYAN|nr:MULTISPECIES: hypothetical protein [Moorena]EGJ28431.1 hypothetical protein LYNGBM3L_73330 [Moorena producens 3L]NEP66347.1 hypothetical protein [Moorena sp. SIO3A5]NER85718.1 hypothetical protein [Moorena sp. SIO3A2]NES41423.1 hypothetical protein [Moorena sp. SIO2C4]
MGRWGDGDLTWVGFLHLGEYVLALGINFSKYVGKSTRISTDYRPISPLAITDYPLPISHYPLPITYYLLPITYLQSKKPTLVRRWRLGDGEMVDSLLHKGRD